MWSIAMYPLEQCKADFSLLFQDLCQSGWFVCWALQFAKSQCGIVIVNGAGAALCHLFLLCVITTSLQTSHSPLQTPGTLRHLILNQVDKSHYYYTNETEQNRHSFNLCLMMKCQSLNRKLWSDFTQKLKVIAYCSCNVIFQCFQKHEIYAGPDEN